MMADWHLGQEIICVDTEWLNSPDLANLPVKGRVYTIDGIVSDGDLNGISFYLSEIRSHNSWFAFHFKPVKKTKTDISELTKLLVPKTKKRVLEDA